MSEDVQVLLMDLPSHIHGFIRKNNDDSFTIVLNSSLSKEAQAAAYWHEIEHLENGDFYSVEKAREIEKLRHG